MLNDLNVDPNEWFEAPHPHDSMPIARDHITDEYAPCDVEYDYERVDPPAELMEVPTSVTNPKPKLEPKKETTIHHKMYEIATAAYNPFAVGGSETLGSIGGSENASEK